MHARRSLLTPRGSELSTPRFHLLPSVWFLSCTHPPVLTREPSSHPSLCSPRVRSPSSAVVSRRSPSSLPATRTHQSPASADVSASMAHTLLVQWWHAQAARTCAVPKRATAAPKEPRFSLL